MKKLYGILAVFVVAMMFVSVGALADWYVKDRTDVQGEWICNGNCGWNDVIGTTAQYKYDAKSINAESTAYFKDVTYSDDWKINKKAIVQSGDSSNVKTDTILNSWTVNTPNTCNCEPGDCGLADSWMTKFKLKQSTFTPFISSVVQMWGNVGEGVSTAELHMNANTNGWGVNGFDQTTELKINQ